MARIEDYIALAIQLKCNAVNHCQTHEEARDMMMSAIHKIDTQLFGTKKFIGEQLKLVVLPEYFLTSYPTRESIPEWSKKACITKDDPIFDKLAEICIRDNIFLSGNYYELDNNFPDMFFQASFILNNKGNMILNYRRLNSMYSPTPHDVLNKYIDLYGYESLFPVADTALGKLACVASEEILYPEVTRCLMMRGAEVILHSSSEIGSALLSKKNIAKRARAIENMVYVVSANSAGIIGGLVPDQSTDGHSQIVHYEGHLLCEALTGESVVAHANVHIQSLREYRSRVSMKNYIARQRFELYADSYAKHAFYPVNQFANGVLPKSAFLGLQSDTIQQLKYKDILSD